MVKRGREGGREGGLTTSALTAIAYWPSIQKAHVACHRLPEVAA